ncbi:MAG: hypothetical protein U0746_01990 [Gemmataceae bacterium]
MKRSWTRGFAVGVLMPLAIGCGSAAHPDCSCSGGLRTPPPYSVVAAPKNDPLPPMAGPMNAVYAPRTQSVPAVVSNPPSASPVIEPAKARGETTSMRVPTPLPTITTGPTGGYQHSPDYTSLVGELHYNVRQNSWRLRYADVGDEDRYGGSVTLDGMGRLMQNYKTGQKVRIEGTLIDPESRDVSPAFRVRDIHPLN